MSMYKIMQNDKVIDVVQQPHFVRFLASGHVAFTDKTSAHGIIGSNNKLYSFKPVARKNISVVSIKNITLEEFNKLRNLLNSGQEPCADEAALATAKYNTILRLSKQCKTQITEGFSITLTDGKLYNFKLTTEDQLNLMMIENQLSTDAEHFLYHATGQECKFFIRTDIVNIIKAFRSHVQYHTTYFNIAKQYINSQTDIKKVNMFTYGLDLSDAVSDPVIKQILKNGGAI